MKDVDEGVGRNAGKGFTQYRKGFEGWLALRGHIIS